MKKFIVIALSSFGLLTGCGTKTISENAKLVNQYTQSDIGTNLEKIGCQLSTNKRSGKQIEIKVNKCSSISNNDAIRYIKENLVDTQNHIKPLVYFKKR